MIFYSGEGVQGARDNSKHCSAFSVVPVRGARLHLSHPNREQKHMASVPW
jgi:hypothetical protein